VSAPDSVTFASLAAHPALQRALAAHGYAEPTPVQAGVLDPALRGKDLLVSSRTGSGKTVAFGLVMAETLLGDAPTFGRGGPPLGLVIAPTRELAVQVQRELAWLFGPAGGIVTACVGGLDPRREAQALRAGVHLVVGTPGRLVDHIERKVLDLSALGALVLDEADEMLDMGFREELEAILKAAPKQRRTILFSATLPKPIVELARAYTREPVRVTATPPKQAHEDITYRAHVVAQREREHAIVNVLRALEPASALVFRARRDLVTHTAASLSERGFETVAISGELTQSERLRALKSLRDGRARVLVATDVAARGLDLPGIELVLHADLPQDASALQHRSGRTGRAGKKGQAVLLASPQERHKLDRMLREAGVTPEWAPVPTADLIRQQDEARLAAEVSGATAEASEDELVAARALLAGRDPLALALALLRRARASLPAPEELPETGRVASEAPRGPRPARPGPPVEATWFRISIGREKKADPKWLLPLLCRRGGVTRDEIGKIVILASETRFEVATVAAARFAAAARVPDPRAPGIRIEPARPPGEVLATRPPTPPRPHEDRPAGTSPVEQENVEPVKAAPRPSAPRPAEDRTPAPRPYAPRPSSSRPAEDRPAAPRPYVPRPSTSRPAERRSAPFKPAPYQSGSFKPGSQKAGASRPGGFKPGPSRPGSHKPRSVSGEGHAVKRGPRDG
jgi:ATP-dependent RNA helicase DeaD